MLKIKKQDFIRFVEVEGRDLSLTRAEMFCDTSDDLPAVDDIDGCILDMGSIAYDIATGDFYVLNSDGEWKNASGEETNAALNASVSDNTRQLGEPIKDTAKAAEAPENEPESIFETIEKAAEPITFDKEVESDGTGGKMEEIPESTSFIEDATVGDENALRDTESR